MREPTLPLTGNDAPAGDADAPSMGPSGDTARKRNPIARLVLASAAGTTATPFQRDGYAVATNRGYADAMGRGLELALTLLVFAGIGWVIDRMAGTDPLFTAILSVTGFIGISVKLWIGYDLEMRQHDDGAVWNRGKGDRDPAGNGSADVSSGTMSS